MILNTASLWDRAMSKCELCFLTKDAVDQLRGQYPELNARITRFQRAGILMTHKQRQRLVAHLAAMNAMTVASVATGGAHQERTRQPSSGISKDEHATRLKHDGRTNALDEQAAGSRLEVDELRQSNAQLKETVCSMEDKLDTMLGMLQKSTLL